MSHCDTYPQVQNVNYMKKRSISVWFTGVSAIAIGLWVTLDNFHALVLMVKQFMPGTIFSLLYSSIFVLLFLGGIAFLYFKEWGRILITACFSIDIALRLLGITNYWYTWLMIKKPIVVPEGYSCKYISMIPGYLILICELAAVYLATRPKVKEQFK